jgi:hypothetical protein
MSNVQLSTLRLTVLFFAGYTVNSILHEFAHALTAYALGTGSTLFHFYVNVDEANVANWQLALIGAAGPLFSLLFGLICLLAYRKSPESPPQLLFLYLSAAGINMFLGNLSSASFVGDFSRVAATLNLPMAARHAITVAGLGCIVVFMFFVGGELLHWAPSGINGLDAMTTLVLFPAIGGGALVVLAFLPTPMNFVTARMIETSFWMFAAAAVFWKVKRPRDRRQVFSLQWLDGVLAITAVILLRVMAHGIRFMP